MFNQMSRYYGLAKLTYENDMYCHLFRSHLFPLFQQSCTLHIGYCTDFSILHQPDYPR